MFFYIYKLIRLYSAVLIYAMLDWIKAVGLK